MLLSDGGILREELAGDVRLDLAFGEAPPRSFVTTAADGTFPLDADLHDAMVGRGFTHWSLSLHSDWIGHSMASDFHAFEENGAECIGFVMPSRRTIAVLVTDLKERPIADAMVDCDTRSGWPHWGESKVRTDSSGIARFALFSDAPAVALRVARSGYVTAAASAVSGEAPITVRLQRLLGVCIVHSDRVIFQEQATMNASGAVFALRPDDVAGITAQHEARHPIAEHEEYRWEILGETKWLEDPRLTVSFSGWFGGDYGSVTFPMQHLADEDFAIHRVPEHIVAQVDPLHEVQFEFEPASAFLAEPPERIQLLVTSADPRHALQIPFEEPKAAASFPISPRRISGTRYRAFLPEGDFTLLARGYDWQPRLPHKDPTLLAEVSIRVRPGAASTPIPVALHPGESFVRQRFVDPFGRPLDLGAVLLPEDDALGDLMIGFFAVAGQGPLGRFVRPGNYSLWIHDQDRVGSVRHPTRYVWSGTADADGWWNVEVDLSALPPALVPR